MDNKWNMKRIFIKNEKKITKLNIKRNKSHILFFSVGLLEILNFNNYPNLNVSKLYKV